MIVQLLHGTESCNKRKKHDSYIAIEASLVYHIDVLWSSLIIRIRDSNEKAWFRALSFFCSYPVLIISRFYKFGKLAYLYKQAIQK